MNKGSTIKHKHFKMYQEKSLNEEYQKLFVKLIFFREYVKINNFEINYGIQNEIFKTLIFNNQKLCYYPMEFNCFNQEDNVISVEDFLDIKNSKFNLLKYVCAYNKIKNDENLKYIENLIIFTNISFDFVKNTTVIEDATTDFEKLLQINIEGVKVNYFKIKENFIDILILKNNINDDIKDVCKKIVFIVVEYGLKEFKDSIENYMQSQLLQILPSSSIMSSFDKLTSQLKENNILTSDDIDRELNKAFNPRLLNQDKTFIYNVIMLLFNRAFFQKIEKFSLKRNFNFNDERDEDFIYSEDNENYRVLKLIYKPNNNDYKINLFDNNFCILKHINYYWEMKKYNIPMKDILLLTNSSFDFNENSNVKEICLDNNNIFKNIPIKYFKFNEQQVDLVLKHANKDLNETCIKEALDNIIFAIIQPNELLKIIENEIKEYFKVSIDDFLWELKHNLIKWYEQNSNSRFPPMIFFFTIDNFFKKNMKIHEFEVSMPSKTFVGRENEINLIRKNLQVYNSCCITGLWGIGKTYLVKKFIQRYKYSDYCGRVIWINAKNQKTITTAINNIFLKFGIKLPELDTIKNTEEIKMKIDLILEYLKGIPILFVFDKVTKPRKYFDYLTYFRESVNTTQHKFLHILITTQNKEYCENKIECINLNVLTEDDAISFVKKSFPEIQNKDNEIRKFVISINCFPLALKQFITYVYNNDNENNVVESFNKNIEQFENEYGPKIIELLDCKVDKDLDDWGEDSDNFESIFSSMLSTLDNLKSKIIGSDAISILEYCAYFDSNEIHKEMFSYILTNEVNVNVWNLLKKYSLFNNEGNEIISMNKLLQKMLRINIRKNGKEHEILNKLSDNLKYLDKKYEKHLNQILSFLK